MGRKYRRYTNNKRHITLGDHPLFSRRHLNSTTICVRLRNTGDTAAEVPAWAR